MKLSAVLTNEWSRGFCLNALILSQRAPKLSEVTDQYFKGTIESPIIQMALLCNVKPIHASLFHVAAIIAHTFPITGFFVKKFSMSMPHTVGKL